MHVTAFLVRVLNSMSRTCIQFYVLFSVGFSLAVLAVLELILAPICMEYMIKTSLPLMNSSESKTFDHWLKTPVPIVTEFFFLNVTNPLQVSEMGDKALLREVGPYVFSETRDKVNIEWSEDGSIVAYDQRRRWHFEPLLSADNSLDDIVYHLNVPLVASADYVHRSRMDDREKLFLYYSINQMHNLTSSLLFHHHSIRELMFDGYTDSLIQESYLLNFEGAPIPYDRFGWFYGRNDTSSDGRYQVYTGTSNLNLMDQMHAWNGSVELKHFYGKCNSLSRVAAEFQPPFQEPIPDSIRIFVGDICRPLSLFFQKQVKRSGVSCNRYIADGRTFDYSLEQNRCYCRDSCPRSGVADTSKCTFDTPSAFSLPHFQFADPFFIEQVRGLNPSPGRHAFFIDIHPQLGIPVDIRIAAQINILVRKDERVDRLQNLKQQEVYFPIFWFAATASATDDMLQELRLLEILPFYVTLIGLVMLISGVTIIIFAIHWNWDDVSMSLLNYRNRKRSQNRKKRQHQKIAHSESASIPLNS